MRTIYLFGPPGVGKTYAAYFIGRILAGVYAITLTEDLPASELRGQYIPVRGEFLWTDGPIVAAMRAGARLVINELSHATPEVLAFLYAVLDSSETVRITLPTNETIYPAPGFQVIVTDNLPPDDLPPALRDRFDCTIEITEPHPDALARLSPRLRRAAIRSFALPPERRVSLRSWLAVERIRGDLGFRGAFIVVFGPKRGAQLYDAVVLGQSKAADEPEKAEPPEAA